MYSLEHDIEITSRLYKVSFYFDIFIYVKAWEEHKAVLSVVLDRLYTHNLTAELLKCKFGCKPINHLGFIADGNYLPNQHSKIEAILNHLPLQKRFYDHFYAFFKYFFL